MTRLAGTQALRTVPGIPRRSFTTTLAGLYGRKYRLTETKYYYDQAGNLTREQGMNNIPGAAATWTRTDYSYNNRNFMTFADSYNGPALAQQAHYTYNAVGDINTMRTGISTDTYATTVYQYDRFGNIQSIRDALNQWESYKHNLAGHLTEKTDRNGAITSYSYDGLGRMLTATVMKDGVNIGSMSQNYTLTGQVLRRTTH
jgi:YD repeat-containing protein